MHTSSLKIAFPKLIKAADAIDIKIIISSCLIIEFFTKFPNLDLNE